MLKTGPFVITLTFIALFSLFSSSFGEADDIPPRELTLEIVYEKSEFNLSRSREPITFDGWVNYTGYSAIPITIHLEAFSDLGDVFLSQYDFTFRIPDSIPFDGFIPIPIDWNFSSTPQMTFYGYVEQGGIQYDIGTVTYIIPVYYYDEEATISEPIEKEEQNSSILWVTIIALLVLIKIFTVFMKRKIRRSII